MFLAHLPRVLPHLCLISSHNLLVCRRCIRDSTSWGEVRLSKVCDLPQEPAALLGWAHMAGGLTPGQDGSSQYSQFPPPLTWTPLSSTKVEHQGLASPSILVHVVCRRPAKVKGKTQLPQEPLPVTLDPAVVVGATVPVEPSEPGLHKVIISIIRDNRNFQIW